MTEIACVAVDTSKPVTTALVATVVIVNFNYGEFLAAAIDSALGQTYRPLEVIVVDDGSTDESRKIIAAYGTRISSVLQENAGQGAAYNSGWAAAKGDIVLFLDSDDVLKSTAISRVVEEFEGNDAVKVQFYLEQVDRCLLSTGRLLPAYAFSSIEPRQQIATYGYYVSPPASGNAFRKDFLDTVMLIRDVERYRRAADGYTTGLAGVVGAVRSISEPLAAYRLHGKNAGGLSGVKTLAQLHHMFMRDIKREDTQHEVGLRFNFHFLSDRSRFCPGHTKFRLLSRRLNPKAHPVSADTTRHLVWSGLASAFAFPHLTWRKRLLVASGFLALAIIPGFFLRAYADALFAAKQINKAP